MMAASRASVAPRTIVTMSYTEQILGTIDARIAEANEQMASLESALEALSAEGGEPVEAAVELAATPAAAARTPRKRAAIAPVARPARATRSTRATRGSRGRTRSKLDADGLTAILQSEPEGLSAVVIAERANAAYNQVLELLREREQAGDVRRTGTRRTSLWRLITDEERIAARAAELAAR
jgi:hypothetical protein